MINKSKQAFTLIELIVVITILAILWTIAFISLQWYSSQARDSKRVSDISNIKKSLELFSLNTWKYPKPDDYNTVSYTWELIWYQWTVWEQVSTNLSRNLNEKPTDPLIEEEYIYSTSNSQTEYEVLGLYENNMLSNLQLFEKINAANFSFAKVEGNYNWLYARTSSFYIPTPSIINWNVWWNVDFADDETLIESQVVTWWDNIPWESTWWLDITLSPYEWVITSNSTDEEKLELVEAIQTAYSWSSLANDTSYADVLSRTSTWELVDFVDVVVLEIAEYSTFASGGWYSGWEWDTWWVNLTWQNVDWSCQIATDITVSWTDLSWNPITQVWAPCNSTLSSWRIYNSYNNIERCYNYLWVNIGWTDCFWYDTLESSYNSTYWIDNIWWKLYLWGSAVYWACPAWRHLPSIEEWTILLKNLWCSDYVSATTTWWQCDWLWWKENLSYNPDRILVETLKIPLAGMRYVDGVFKYDFRGDGMGFWSSDEYSSTQAKTIHVNEEHSTVYRYHAKKMNAYSVRCIKD